jgi:hypothetical protein
MSNLLRSATFVLLVLTPAIAHPATVTEPGRDGKTPIQVAPNSIPGTSPGSAMDAPGGVGPGFTSHNDQPPGIVAPGTIGKNGISPSDNGQSQ